MVYQIHGLFLFQVVSLDQMKVCVDLHSNLNFTYISKSDISPKIIVHSYNIVSCLVVVSFIDPLPVISGCLLKIITPLFKPWGQRSNSAKYGILLNIFDILNTRSNLIFTVKYSNSSNKIVLIFSIF